MCPKFLLVLPSIFFTLAVQATDFGTQNGTQYYPYLEWQVVDSTFTGNPFDVIALVQFNHPSGEEIETEMFYLGDSTWGFRFAGTSLGNWSFVTAAADADLDGHIGEAVISVNPDPAVRGFLTGETQFYWSGTNEAIIPNYLMYFNDIVSFLDNPAQIDADITEFMEGHGFNGFHVPYVCGRWFDHDAPTTVVNSTYEDPDFKTFEALELLIIQVYLAGGHIHIWPWGDHQRRWTARSLADGINGEQDLRLQRYIAARLGPVAGWSMGYGFDLDEWVDLPQLDAWQEFMDDKLGWPHLLGGRFHEPNSGTDHSEGVSWNQAMIYSAWEHHKPTTEVFRAAMQAVTGQPTFSEDRFRIRTSTRPKDFAVDGIDTRRTLWYGAIAGGVASIWGNLGSRSDGKSDIYPNKEQLKTFARFFDERFQKDLLPIETLTSEPALFNPTDSSFLVYLEADDGVTLDLPLREGSYQVIAVDAELAYSEIDLGLFEPGSQNFNLPGISDWGLHINSEASTTTPWLEVTDIDLTMYPCPAGNNLTIAGDLPKYDLTLLDSSGATYSTISNVGSRVEVDISQLPVGLFFIRIVHKTNQSISLQKIVKGF